MGPSRVAGRRGGESGERGKGLRVEGRAIGRSTDSLRSCWGAGVWGWGSVYS